MMRQDSQEHQKEKKTMFNFNTKLRSGKTNTILEFCKLKIKQ